MKMGLDGSPAAAAVLKIQLMDARPVVGERMSGVLGIGPGSDNRCPADPETPEVDVDPLAAAAAAAAAAAVVLKTPR